MDDIALSPRRTPPVPKRLIAGVAIAAVLVAAGVIYRAQGASPPPAARYLTAAAESGDVSSGVTATGPIAAVAAVPLNFKLSGRVAEIDVQVGDAVAAGQVLARLDPTDLQAQLRQAQANLAAAQASYRKLVQGPTATDVAAARATVDAARTQVATEQRNHEAAQSAMANDAAAAQASVASARQEVAAAEQALEDAQRAAADAQSAFDALPAVIAQQIATAKNNLWARQLDRDAICGRGKGAACNTANAQVAAAETAVDQAGAQAAQETIQGQTTVDQAQAQVNQAQAQVDRARASVSEAQANVASAQARAAQAVQSAQGRAELATSGVQTAQAAYDRAVSRPTQAEIDGATAQIAVQQANVDLAQTNLDSAVMTAPSAGVVTALNGAVGQWLTGGSTSGAAASAATGANNSAIGDAGNFISLTDLSRLQIRAQVNEADVSRVRAGQQVRFTVDAFTGQTFEGKVQTVQPLGATLQNVVWYTVLIDTAPAADATLTPTPVSTVTPEPRDSEARLLPGMTASVTILTTDLRDVVLIPNAAISYSQSSGQSQSEPSASPIASAAQGAATVIVVSDGVGSPRSIQTGASDDHNTQVLSGLEPGEHVAVGAALAGP
jgi:HlyD family secretion protein